MATYNKHNAWVENMVEAANCGSDQFTVYLTATANAPVATNSVLADVTQIAYTNLSSRNWTTTTAAHTTGTYTLDFDNLVLSASGGAVAAFQYVGTYDDTVASPVVDPLVSWFDYGSSLTLNDGDSLTLTVNASGYFTLT